MSMTLTVLGFCGNQYLRQSKKAGWKWWWFGNLVSGCRCGTTVVCTWQFEDLIGVKRLEISWPHSQSLGISVAKHRLEIIKLAGKEIGGGPHSLSWLISAITKTRKGFTRSISKWVFHKDSAQITAQELAPYRAQWSGALRNPKERKQENMMVTSRATMRSGPLDRRVQERLMVTSRSLSISGPLDRHEQEKFIFSYRSPTVTRPVDEKIKERATFANRSPMASGPLDGRGLSPNVNGHSGKENGGMDGVSSLWSLMFQDLKPT